MPTVEELQAQLEQARAEAEEAKAETARVKATSARAGGMKVSEKGAVSVYGLGRFPVTLYPEQWDRLLGMSDQIKTFIEDNRDKLKWKTSE